MQEEFYRQAIDVQFSGLKGRCTVMKRDQTPTALKGTSNTTDILFMNIQYIDIVFGGLRSVPEAQRSGKDGKGVTTLP